MISEDTLKSISLIFVGDEGNYYFYKKGSELVTFFNKYYNVGEKYGQGFPSRWVYVYDKLADLLNKNKFDGFLNIILDKKYIMVEQNCSLVEAAEKSEEVLRAFRDLVRKDGYVITYNNNQFHLLQENQDLVLIGSGGFANVYRQKSTGLIVKRLKDDFLTNASIRSRFKREYTITNSLQDIHGIIRVFDYDKDNCSYTMEEAERTFERYILDSNFNEDTKITCIRMILNIMKEVHSRGIIHRDLSPNNIFVLHGYLKIADFGLGKDLNMFTSHQTIHTNSVGQYYYCAPEQFMMLKEGSMKSDVYSLGRIINFIMTEDPNNSHHTFRSVAEKATNADAISRYEDAGQLLTYFEKSVSYHQNAKHKEKVLELISTERLNDEIEDYLFEMSGEQMCQFLINKQAGFQECLLQFMAIDDAHANFVIHAVDNKFTECCSSFASYDPIALFAYKILDETYPYVIKEIAANILRYVAKVINRYYAMRLLEKILDQGLEPMLEEILES